MPDLNSGSRIRSVNRTACRPNDWRFEAEAKSSTALEPVPRLDDGEQFARSQKELVPLGVQGSGQSRLMQEVAVCPQQHVSRSALVSARGTADSARAQRVGSAELLLEELDADWPGDRAAPPAGSAGGRRLPLCVPATDDICRTPRGCVCIGHHTARWRRRLDQLRSVCRGWSACAGAVVGLVTDDAQQPLPGASCLDGDSQAVKTADGTFSLRLLTDLQQLAIEAEQAGSSESSRICSSCMPARTAATSR